MIKLFIPVAVAEDTKLFSDLISIVIEKFPIDTSKAATLIEQLERLEQANYDYTGYNWQDLIAGNIESETEFQLTEKALPNSIGITKLLTTSIAVIVMDETLSDNVKEMLIMLKTLISRTYDHIGMEVPND